MGAPNAEALASVRSVVMGDSSAHTHDDVEALIRAYREFIPALEQELWASGCNPSLLDRYQAAHRQMERLIAEQGGDGRHRIVVVVSVADRPRLLQDCLDSLVRVCELYQYGGVRGGRYPKVALLVADDSADAANAARHRALADSCAARGIDTLYCGPDEQLAWVDALPPVDRERLQRILGDRPRDAFFHKGSSVMRNITYLKLRDLWRASDEPLLFHFIDSDQEFRVKAMTAAGERDEYALSYFHGLDRLFREHDALIATGKVVGDPPVSPSVMTSRFLDDVIAFVAQATEAAPDAPCPFHGPAVANEDNSAIYHDMPELFGFAPVRASYAYACPLRGLHTTGDGIDRFAARLERFFLGEHPTRRTHYRYEGPDLAVAPARTVYAGNYVLRPEALRYFIPFAALRLRMPGPTLGRIVKAELGARFVAANLPMLHQRTAGDGGGAGFRPGIDDGAAQVDLSGEFVRQFHGDVMLFGMERLTAAGYPQAALSPAAIAATLDAMRDELLASYNRRQRAIGDKLAQLGQALDAQAGRWSPASMGRFRAFAATVEHNFGAGSAGYRAINDAAEWARQRARMVEAVAAYRDDRDAWESVLAGP